MKSRSRFAFLIFPALALLSPLTARAQTGFGFVPISPCRIVDTRSGLGGHTGLLPDGFPGWKYTIKNASPCNVPSNASAVVFNMTVADSSNQGWVALFPGAGPWGGVANINFFSGAFIANGAIVPVSAGSLDLSVLAAFAPGNPPGANLILDVTGYFTPTGGVSFYAVTPCRAVDTETGLGGYSGLLPNGLPGVNVTLKGSCGIPSDATAVALNATVTSPQRQGWIALFPSNQSWGGAASINFFADDDIANGAIVPVAPGTPDLTILAAYAPGGTPGTHLKIDITGYFK